MATKQTIKDNLGYLGDDFQYELVKTFIEDQQFFKNVEGIVDQNMFTIDTLRRIVGFMKDRYALNDSVATYLDLDKMIRGKVSDAVTQDKLLGVIEKLKTLETSGIDIIEGYSERFFKQQNLTKAMNEAYAIIKAGEVDRYDDIEDIIKNALTANNRDDYGYRVFDHMEDALSDNYRVTIPTGADELDRVLGGGLAKGELGVIIAPSSVGKTSATVGFAATAAITKKEDNNFKGYKVMHIHFEDEEVNIKRKYYAYVTNIDASDLSKPEIRPQAIEILKNSDYKELINENIVVYHPLSGEWSPTDIKRKIQKQIAVGFKPDLLIVDYFECLKLERGSSIEDKEYTREGITMRKLEAIAHEFNIAVWCPVQGTKDSFNQQVVGLSQAGGSVKKVQIGHVIISFARTEEMRLHDLLNIFINKFRAGRITKNHFINVTFNNGTTHFDFSSCTEIDDTLDSQQAYQTDMAKQTKASLKK